MQAILALPGDDVRDMRAMTLEVNRIRVRRKRTVRPIFSYEIVSVDDLGRWEQPVAHRVQRRSRAQPVGCLVRCLGASAEEIAMRIVDTGIEDRHADAGAVDAQQLHGLGANVGDRLRQIELVIRHAAYRCHAGQLTHFRYAFRVDGNYQRIGRLRHACDLASTHIGDASHQRRLLGIELREIALLLRTAHRKACALRIGTQHRHERLVGEPDYDIDLSGRPAGFAADANNRRIDGERCDIARALRSRRTCCEHGERNGQHAYYNRKADDDHGVPPAKSILRTGNSGMGDATKAQVLCLPWAS